MKVLVDTSVWIDFFRGHDSPHVGKLEELLINRQDICVCGLIVMEILQGISREREHQEVKKLLSFLIYLPLKRELFESSAKMYRVLRAEGVTLRNSIDCLIASVVLDYDVYLLHADRDYDFIKEKFPLKII